MIPYSYLPEQFADHEPRSCGDFGIGPSGDLFVQFHCGVDLALILQCPGLFVENLAQVRSCRIGGLSTLRPGDCL